MLTDRHFPYSSMQEINLDWILTKVKNILRFVPDDGAVGQILRRTAHGAEWSNEQGGGGGAVTSVNGQTGDVILSIPTDTSDLNNDSGFVDAAGAAAAAPVQKVNGQTGIVTINKTAVGLGNVQNVLQYSASNPPPYPVTSVNTQTGDVVLSIPTDVSDLNNDSGFVDAAGAAAAAPVQSVNGQTGTVSLSIPDISVEQLTVTAVGQSAINVNAKKSGNVVLVTGQNAVYPAAINADTKIATISEAPSSQAFGIGKTLTGADIFVFVTTSGELFVSGLTPVGANVNMYFSLVYFV